MEDAGAERRKEGPEMIQKETNMRQQLSLSVINKDRFVMQWHSLQLIGNKQIKSD